MTSFENKKGKKDPAEPENWLVLELLRGIVKLSRLPLAGKPRTPDEEKAVADVWAEAVWPNRGWNAELDTPRIREAFRRLAAGHRYREGDQRNFPRPDEFESAMPPRRIPDERQVEHKPGPKLPQEESDKRWAALRSWMDQGPGSPPPPIFPKAQAEYVARHGGPLKDALDKAK